MPSNEEKIIRESFVTLSLRKAFKWSRTKRVPSAIRSIKKYIKRHFKVEDHQITISQELNELLWCRGKKKAFRKIKIIVQQTDKQIIRVLSAK
ncbi:MAG: 50S ribosomal protein L31e [Candidatus Methanomethylicia archaeon]